MVVTNGHRERTPVPVAVSRAVARKADRPAVREVWRRDLVSGDSAVVLEDSTVVRLAGAYARTHPDAEPLAPDEDAETEG